VKLDDFFALYKVFTFKDLELNLSSSKDSPAQTSTLYNLITYHQNQGHILRIRRGLYYSVPKGMDSAHCPVDPLIF
jgi:hypothetical protein